MALFINQTVVGKDRITGRIEVHVVVDIDAPNSGKTLDALTRVLPAYLGVGLGVAGARCHAQGVVEDGDLPREVVDMLVEAAAQDQRDVEQKLALAGLRIL